MSQSALSLIIVALLAGAIQAESASPLPAAPPPAAAASPPSAALPSAAPPITRPPAPSLMTASEPPLSERRAAITKEIQDISIRYLGSADPEMNAEGRRRMLAIRDPAGAEAVVRILGIGDEKTRGLACEVLGQMVSDDAARLLAKFVLTEESEPVRLAATSAIKMRTDRAAIQPLVNGLNGPPETMKRAAYALGEIGDLTAALSLVTHLRRAETRIALVPAPDTPTPSMFIGTIIPYVAGARAIVSGRAAAVKPQVGYIGVGSGFGGGEEPTVVRRMYVAWVPQPEIRAALAKIAGQDFVYNPAAWRDWIERALQKERDQARAERQAAQPLPQAPPQPAARPASNPIPPSPGGP
jgi:hypothetical protein